MTYALSCPETHQVFGDHAMGFWTSASPVIHSIHDHDYSVYSFFPEFCPPFVFHVSKLRFVSCFRFTLHFCPPCSISICYELGTD